MRRCAMMFAWSALWMLTVTAAPLAAQVFDVSPTADVGEVDPGTGQAFYGTFGLDAANNSERSYSVYRKLDGIDRADTGPDIHTFTPIPDNPTAAIWEGVDHGGSGTQSGFHDPGMFIGNSPSTSSYDDQLIYFSRNRNGTTIDDPDGGVGGNNLPDGTVEPDSNDRVNWEVAVGFFEDPDGFIDGRSPHSGQWDMWSGDWGTDGISTRLFFTASDSPDLETENSDWFSFNEPAGGDFGSRAQSGDPDSAVSGETGRTPIPVNRRYVGSGTEVPAEDGEFLAGGSGQATAVHVGVSYDHEMELSWRLELNDPDNPDPQRAREVRFTAKTGSVEYYSVFDPGSPTVEAIPNEDDTPYTDGYFNWQAATPVFYLGLDNGTDYGEEGAWGIMGVFEPGDLNADGVANAADLEILQNHLGQSDTSYSRGDIDQDGDTDVDDLAALEAILGGGNPADRIDAIKDLNERIQFVHDVIGTWMGDSNLDGEFNSADFVAVFTQGEYEDAVDGNSTWSEGDWNGDSDFDSSDFVVAFTDGGYEMGPRPATASVPEPAGWLLIAAGTLWVSLRRRARFW